MAHSKPTKAFPKLRDGHAVCTLGVHPPTSPSPTLSAEAEPISKGHCRKWDPNNKGIMLPSVNQVTGQFIRRLSAVMMSLPAMCLGDEDGTGLGRGVHEGCKRYDSVWTQLHD